MTEYRTTGVISRDTEHRLLAHGCRRVLVVVPSVAVGTRFTDVLPLVEADHRVSVAFTAAPITSGAARRGIEEFLRALAFLVLPWQEAIRQDFDLVLAADSRGLEELNGTTLLLPDDEDAVLLRRTRVPHVVALSHDSAKEVLAESYPGSIPKADVVGDIAYDRLLASIPFRARYREALGLSRGQRLVLTSYRPDLVRRLVDELPTGHFRVAVTVEPDLWHMHGGWQVRAWLADCLDEGALLVPSGEGWRAALIAADLVIGDREPVVVYGAALGLATMIVTSPGTNVRRDSSMDIVRQHASPLCGDRPLVEQVRTAMEENRMWQDRVAARLTSRPGRAGETLRRVIYRELDLREPARAVPCLPVPVPYSRTGLVCW